MVFVTVTADAVVRYFVAVVLRSSPLRMTEVTVDSGTSVVVTVVPGSVSTRVVVES